MSGIDDDLHAVDLLRTPESVLLADLRADLSVGTPAPDDPLQKELLHRRLEKIRPIELHLGVPRFIRARFETARNLYVYTHFVYRFGGCAEFHAIATLEFALCHVTRGLRAKGPGLGRLLSEAIDRKIVDVRKIEDVARHADVWARELRSFEISEEMRKQGRTEWDEDMDGIAASEGDFEYFYKRELLGTLRDERNQYAHGGPLMRPPSLRIFRIVRDVINQLYLLPGGAPSSGESRS